MAWPPTTHQDAADEITSLRDGKGWASTLGARHRFGEAIRSAPLLWTAGRWNHVHLLGGGTGHAPVASELRVIAFYVPSPRAIDRVGCQVTTAGTAGHVARMGIFNGDPITGLPATVLVDSGPVAVDSTGVKEVAVTATLQGLYWLGLTTQSGTFVAFTNSTTPYIGSASGPGGFMASVLSYPTVDPTVALPDRTGVAPVYGTATYPTVAVRAA